MAKEFWEKTAPKGTKPKTLSTKGKSVAKASAKAAGRLYPNLIDNAAAKRKFRLASPHSKVQLDEDGSNEIEVSLEPSTVAPRSNSL